MTTLYTAVCGICGQDGEWFNAEARNDWIDCHFGWTGHDDPFCVDRPYESPKWVQGARKALYPGRCARCGTSHARGDLIAPFYGRWQCVDCAPDSNKEAS